MKWLSKPWRIALAASLLLASIPAYATVYNWSQTAASNSTADATINWAEGQAPSTVNDSARAMMAAISKWRDDLAGVKPSNAIVTVAGSTTAYTVTSNQSLSSLTNGFTLTFKVGSSLTNGADVTLAVDSLDAKKIQGVAGTDLDGGELVEGSTYTVTYHQPSDAWILHSFYSGSSGVPAGASMDFWGTSAPDGWLLSYGQAVSRTTYARLFAAIGTTYGVGDGSTTFNLPDTRGRVVAGQDDMGGTSANRLTGLTNGVNGDTLGGTGGAESFTLAQANLPSYNLDVSSLSMTGLPALNISTVVVDISTPNSQLANVEAGSGESVTGFDGNDLGETKSSIFAGLGTMDVGGTLASGGSGTAKGHIQPTIIANKIIKY